MSKLKTLSLSRNLIVSLKAGVFNGLENLTELKLDADEIDIS
jgi:Leucine-rich repeat (LRR) protein